MAIETIFANMSCSDLSVSEPWYAKLFGRPADRHPMAGLAEWHFTASAEMQLYEDKAKAGKSTMTIGVLPLGFGAVREADETVRRTVSSDERAEPKRGAGQQFQALEEERARLLQTGIAVGAIEPAEHFFIMRLSDPDGNLVVLASAER